MNLNINYPPDVPRHLISDSYCVTSIILNLMSNAVKFTYKGYVTISVKILSKNEKFTTLQITVEDTGRGIPSDKLEQIFDRFHRLERSNKGLTEGHGIGLSVVKELVDKLNGEINVKSEFEKGTVFTVNLTFEILDAAIFISEWKKRYPSIRILLGSDQSTDTVLEQLGKNIVTKAESTNIINELLSAVHSNNPYQIIIIDDEIELLDPLDLINTILSVKEIPKLMWLLSSRPKDKVWFDKARVAGYFDFIIKPILPTELDEKLIATWENWQKK